MRNYMAALMGLGFTLAIPDASFAACTQFDLQGTWAAFGTYGDLAATVPSRCTLKFGNAGILVSTSRCTYRDPTISTTVTVGVVGGLVLKSAINCTFEGTISISGGIRNGNSSPVKAGMSRDKLSLSAVGNVNVEPTGGVSFSALKQ